MPLKRDNLNLPINSKNDTIHYAKEEILYDDFKTLNTTLWETRSNRISYPTSDGDNIILTSLIEGMYGQIWLKTEINTGFEAEFSFYIGGGSCGDGLVFMFFKDKNYAPADGGELGFSDLSDKGISGFGVEIDTYGNEYDPYGSDVQDNASHIAVIENRASKHLASYQVSSSNLRNTWHTLKVRVTDNLIQIWLDDNQIINYANDTLQNRQHSWMGFSAATGENVDYHKIGFFRLWRLAILEEKITTASSNFLGYILIVIVLILASTFIVLKKRHYKIPFSKLKALREPKRTESIKLNDTDFDKILTAYIQKHGKVTSDILNEIENGSKNAFGKWVAEKLINKGDYNTAKDILIVIKDYNKAITVLISLAIMKKSQGNIDEAKAIYLEIADLLRKIGDLKRSNEILQLVKTL